MAKSFLITINGTVQGVGFRPFIAGLANKLELKGFVENRENGVRIIVRCSKAMADTFVSKIQKLKPLPAKITGVDLKEVPDNSNRFDSFKINPSKKTGTIETFIPPDIAMCEDCVHEMFDSNNRRYLYPFTNCSHCGPRFTIIETLPYDRKMTTMKDFEMCGSCIEEYTSIPDRRYHAQTDCCTDCGPEYVFHEKKSSQTFSGNKATEMAIDLLKNGGILAIKGIGGFHIACDPDKEETVKRLRKLKNRPFKPFALMARDSEVITSIVHLDERERETLLSYQRPIILLKKKTEAFVSTAPGMNTLGVMLPYTGIQHLLLEKIPLLIMTSGNLKGELLCGENKEGLEKLSPMVDGFLLHNRRIINRCDDTVIKFSKKKKFFLRRARGYIPVPINLSIKEHPQVLATGADLKGSFGLCRKGVFFGSQFLGDLSYRTNQDQYHEMLKRFQTLFDLNPEVVISDIHPNYFSTGIGESYANKNSLEILYCQHHVAHSYSVMAEKKLSSCIGVSFDGTGYGTDGKIWGGEFFLINGDKWERIAHLRYVPMPGGELAVKSPEIMAASYLEDSGINCSGERTLNMILNAGTKTSSAGRLFDSVAALLGICKFNSFEGEAPMRLEAISKRTDKALPWSLNTSKTPWEIDFREGIRTLNTRKDREPIGELASKFHFTLAKAVSETCLKLRKITGEKKVCLSGGVFQNSLLLDQTISLLERESFAVYSNEVVSPNDEGTALGQTYWYLLGCDKYVSGSSI